MVQGGGSHHGRPHGRQRQAVIGAVALALSLCVAGLRAQPAAPAASAVVKPKRPPRVLPGGDVELKTKDGWTLSARFLPPKDPLKPTLLLLHETGGRKENWYFLARALARNDYGVMAVDFRGHGGSQSPPAGQPSHWRKFPAPTKAYNEWNNLLLDVDAAVEYVGSQGVQLSSMVFGGADVGSSVALKYAAVHSQVPLLFMLSPGMRYREIPTVNAIRAYGKRPILLVVGADDNRSTRETAILFEFAKRVAGPENTQLLSAEREHGTRILVVNKGVVGKILDWIADPMLPLDPQVSTETAPGAPAEPAAGAGPEALPSDEQLRQLPPAPGDPGFEQGE